MNSRPFLHSGVRADDWTGIDDPGGAKRLWGISFLAVAGFFIGAAWLALHWAPRVTLPAPAAAAMMIDLAPLPAAPPTPPTQAPPGPKPVLSQTMAAPATQPLPSGPVLPLPKAAMPPARVAPHRARLGHRHRPLPHPETVSSPATTAPPDMAAPPAATTASATPMPPVPAASTSAVPDWQSTLLGRLEQFKRYPASAQYRGEQGVAYLRFSMDRDGNVLSASIAKTSGYDDLDAETLALIRRAQPLPKPPAEIPGNTIELTVPVQFFLQAQG